MKHLPQGHKRYKRRDKELKVLESCPDVVVAPQEKKEAAQLDQSQNAGLSSAPPGTSTQI
jgi:hypothetical protein